MKNLKKLLVLLLAATMVFSLVACNNGGTTNNGDDSGDKRGEANPIDRTVGLSEEQLENYIVEFTVSRPQSVQDEVTGKYIEVVQSFGAREVAFEGYRHSTNVRSEIPVYTPRDNSCFTYTDQDDYRGWFAAHKQYLGDDVNADALKELGTETVAGFETKHYQFKMGIYDINFWVSEEYDLTIKYEYSEKDFNAGGEFVLKKSLEITKLEFGVADYDEFYYSCPTPTLKPVEDEA